MKLRLLPLVCLLAGCATATIPAGTPCVTDGFTVEDNFVAARRGTCKPLADNHVRVNIRPESEGYINNSPWYAFRVVPHGADQARVTLQYSGGNHRYPAKVSYDGNTWTRLDPENITVNGDNSTADLLIPLDDRPVWIAAQEIISPKIREIWRSQIFEESGIEPQVLGQSLRGLDIHGFDSNPELREVLLIIGGQHPPEVSGAFAFLAFAETVLGSSELAQQFRDRYRVIAIPMLNPDGVMGGNWRHNLADTDLNRDWGPFLQPETQIVRDLLDELDAEGSELRMFADFHSTKENIFYTQHDPTDPPGFTARWLTNSAPRISEYDFRIGNAPPKTPNAAKNYIFRRYGIPSITYEVGDETDRDATRAAAQVFAEELMAHMLELDSVAGE